MPSIGGTLHQHVFRLDIQMRMDLGKANIDGLLSQKFLFSAADLIKQLQTVMNAAFSPVFLEPGAQVAVHFPFKQHTPVVRAGDFCGCNIVPTVIVHSNQIPQMVAAEVEQFIVVAIGRIALIVRF